ncbi:unnamed protein product [Ostreobium quekettii]|uniref:Uncharacterized protein n=1 Tax=Ostreobium quekettii TaxID=121088 RepID=A0A8S1IRK0_9CHLO|nr:unnamed protein product [Ostreobium quekettii]
MDKHQLTSIPRKGWLMQCGRRDIVHAIYREGGFSSVAARMGVDMNRKKHRQWGSMQEVVEELKAFMDASGSKDKGEAAHLPTRAQLEGAGRADLAYAVQKYGHCALSELAGMEPRKVGTHNRA